MGLESHQRLLAEAELDKVGLTLTHWGRSSQLNLVSLRSSPESAVFQNIVKELFRDLLILHALPIVGDDPGNRNRWAGHILNPVPRQPLPGLHWLRLPGCDQASVIFLPESLQQLRQLR